MTLRKGDIMLHSLMNSLKEAREAKDWKVAIHLCNVISNHCYDEFFKAQINNIKHNIEDGKEKECNTY